VVKGEGKATGKVAGRVKVKPNGLPDYPVITSNWVNYLLWPQCLNGVRHQSARSPPSGLSPPESVLKPTNLLDYVCRFLKR
jgi:hypothetical protein